MPLVTIKQGESYDFSFDRGDDSISGWTCVINLKQYPSDVALVKRTVTATNDKWAGLLTQRETKNLPVGQYLIIASITKGTEKEVQTDRFHIGKGW